MTQKYHYIGEKISVIDILLDIKLDINGEVMLQKYGTTTGLHDF